MLRFMQDIFLSDVIIFLMVFVMFVGLSWWALRIREYAGYGLGWMIGLFFMLVYSSLLGEQAGGASAQVASPSEVTLTFFQVICPSALGIIVGAGSLYLSRVAGTATMRQAVTTAFFTALGLIILFFLTFVADSEGRRMIGIFTLAFGIAAMFIYLIYARLIQPSHDDEENEPRPYASSLDDNRNFGNNRFPDVRRRRDRR